MENNATKFLGHTNGYYIYYIEKYMCIKIYTCFESDSHYAAQTDLEMTA